MGQFADGNLPPGFVPQTLTDAQGVSTPIWQNGSLPSGPGPVYPGGGSAPPRASSSGSGGGKVYGNPLHKDRDHDRGASASTSSFGIAPPPIIYTPSHSPVIPGAPGGPPSMLHGPGGSSGYGGPRNGPGMTPITSPRDLPQGGPPGPGYGSGFGAGYGGSNGSTGGTPVIPGAVGPRSGVSIYGPPVGGGMPPSMPVPGPVPPYGRPHGHEDEDEEDDGFDPMTTQNTRLNAASGRRR